MNPVKLCKLSWYKITATGVVKLCILILGPSGQVGYDLAKSLRNSTIVNKVVTAGRSEADIIMDPLNSSQLSALFLEVKPDIVINAIAYTAVDKAESEQEQAFLLNADLPSALADHCEQSNALLIHYSTDFIFDGSKTNPWREDDESQPLSVYGRSKLAGEKAIQIASCPSVILRTSWVYADRGNNFMLTMLRLGRERDSLSVVNDQIGSPTCSYDIAMATGQLCEQYLTDPSSFKNHSGIYHLTSSGSTSWYGFAKTIFELASPYESLAINDLSAITSDQYPVAATRPAYSVLDCGKIKKEFGIELPHWEESLKQCLKKYYLNH